jgi:hypothetical protein
MLKAAWWGSAGTLAVLLYAGCSDDGQTKTSGESVATCDCPIDWTLANTSLCVAPHTTYSPPVLFSSHLDDDGEVACDATLRFPQPVSKLPWSSQEITSRCTGKGTLTLRIRAGKAKSASQDDCLLTEQSFDFDYTQANRSLALEDVAAWSAQSEACSREFESEGGYFEFRVESDALGCAMPGGSAAEQSKVNYIDICLASCQGDASRPGCEACGDKPDRNRI